MKRTDVKAKKKGMDESVSINYKLPETTEEAVKKYGEEVVFSRFRSALVIDVQAVMRGAMEGDKITPAMIEACQKAVDEFKPGVKAVGKTDLEKARDAFTKLTPEERKALFEATMKAAEA